MKELSIEEKAKAYDEVVERAKIEKEKSRNLGLLEFIENSFPQLKESEDEKIRKHLISFFDNLITFGNASICETEDIKVDNILAWLEKQGEKDKFIEKELGCIKGYRENAIKMLEELEKQGEQGANGNERGIPNSSWSEYDSPYYDDICEILINLLHSETADVNKDVVQKDLDWLKSLKDRVQPQPKQEWSEEDKTMIESIIDYMQPMPIFFESTIGKSGKEYTEKFIKDATKWLKSLRPQSQWKPSNEQIETLGAWLRDNRYKGDARYCYPIFDSLYKQLKKLKGEKV